MDSPNKKAFDCDLVFQGAWVIDGTGVLGFTEDVAIQGDKIVHIGNCSQWQAKQVIPLQGLVLAPGFIDTHTHDDWSLVQTPSMPFKVSQGVTTVIAGNCGISAAPFKPAPNLPDPFHLLPHLAEQCYASVADYRQAVTEAKPAVNVRLLVGHSSLRALVMGSDLQRSASTTEIADMASLLDQALKQGAAGLSSGLDYTAALDAASSELVALAKVVARYPNKVYTTHVRDEGDEVIAAVQEALDTAKSASVPLVLSHHKCAGQHNFGKSQQTLEMVDAARCDHEVALDVYPYTASSTSLSERFIAAAKDVLVTWSQPHPESSGQMLDDIALGWGISRELACQRLSPAGAIYFDMDEKDLQRILKHPAAMIGSDGLPGTPLPHPRLWGTFPRVLGHYVRELELLSLVEAVHKMTGLSASKFGLTDRGTINVGKQADLVVFDANKIKDMASFENPELPAEGIHHVLVNGQFVMHNGQQTINRPGQFLSK